MTVRFHRLRKFRDLYPVIVGTLVTSSLVYYLASSQEHAVAIAPDLPAPTSLSFRFADKFFPAEIARATQPITPNHAEEDERGPSSLVTKVSPAGLTAYSDDVPETEIVAHEPGWTIFRNLYMSGGTLFIVTSKPDSFPDIQHMTSTGLPADSTPENGQLRMPTSENMDFLTLEEAKEFWGKNGKTSSGILPIEGNTWLFNDPPQFLNHYYHFCAELLFGTWAFWSGTFNSSFTPYGKTTAPPVHRAIFVHSGDEWRDPPGFNSYFLRAAFPSLTLERAADWRDRVDATKSTDSQRLRAFRFDTVLLADRSAAFRSEITGAKTQRTAAAAFEPLHNAGRLNMWWWEPIRRAVVEFAGVDEQTVNIGAKAYGMISEQDQMRGIPLLTKPVHGDVVVTYISRQAVKRRLIDQDHRALVAVLTEMCSRRGWELNVVAAEDLSKDEQVKIMARTTVLLGVHGNGLTHLIILPITPRTTVIEIFYPDGFARDYEWTARALGFKHFAVRYNEYATYPTEPSPNYPEGFQGVNIPVHAPTVARLIESRIDGKL